jgi:hypothetical protein
MKNYIYILLVLILPSFSIAQTSVVKGKIIDATTKKGIDLASVVLKLKTDTSKVYGAKTKEDGTFEIKNSTGYSLCVSIIVLFIINSKFSIMGIQLQYVSSVNLSKQSASPISRFSLLESKEKLRKSKLRNTNACYRN